MHSLKSRPPKIYLNTCLMIRLLQNHAIQMRGTLCVSFHLRNILTELLPLSVKTNFFLDLKSN